MQEKLDRPDLEGNINLTVKVKDNDTENEITSNISLFRNDENESENHFIYRLNQAMLNIYRELGVVK